jgi:MFS family permease
MLGMSGSPHPLSYRNFQLFWLARFSAVMATMAMIVVIGWQVYDIARSDCGMTPSAAAFQLGLLGLAQFVPLFVLTPVAGWVADRFERRLVACLANSIDAAIAFALAWLTMTHALTLPLLFLVAAAHGVARVFAGPSMGAMVSNIVPPEALPSAIALNAMAWQIGSVIGPAIGGFLYGANPALPYWVAGGLLAFAMLSLSFLKVVHSQSIKGEAHPVRQMVEGLRYTVKQRFLLGTITLDLFAVLFAGATALLPVYARDILMVGPQGLGWLRAAPAFGAAAIALILAVRPLKHNVGVKMLAAVVLFGCATALFGLSTNFVFSLAMLAVCGGADMLSVYVRSALVQLNTPDAMLGRVSSVSTLAVSASNELGEMESGLLAALIGPVGAVVFGGIGAILVTGLWAWLFPELRNARTFEPQIKDATR